MIPSLRNRFFQNNVKDLLFTYPFHVFFPSSQKIFNHPYMIQSCSNLINQHLSNLDLLNHTHFMKIPTLAPNAFTPLRTLSTKPYYKRKKRNRPKTIKDFPHKLAEFQSEVARLPPRFTSEDLYKSLNFHEDPYVCLELFNYASQQPRFRHDDSTYHLTIKKLGTATMYEEMDRVVKQVLAIPGGSEALFNTIIYFYTEARWLSKAVNVFQHMKNSMDLGCRPTIRTYNLLFTAFLSKRNNSMINHMYMETIRCLFKQMVNDGIEPDIIALNSMIKGYVLSLHVNDALRIFHQMGVVFSCPPDMYSHSYIIHGLCCQGRTNNAKEIYRQMRKEGFVPSAKAYNSLANSLAIGGEVDEAVRILWEMNEEKRVVHFITYRTVLDEICRQVSVADAMRLLQEFQEKDLVDGLSYRKLLHVIEDGIGDSDVK